MDKILGYIEIGKNRRQSDTRVRRQRIDQGRIMRKAILSSRPSLPTSSPDMRIEQEEIFGPVTCVIPFSTLDEAIDIVNGVQYGLSSAIYTQDVNNAFHAMQELYTGICYVNSATIGAEVHLPFGGTKGTGNGHREAGHAGARYLQRMEIALRRLFRQTAKSADRRGGHLDEFQVQDSGLDDGLWQNKRKTARRNLKP